jgi:hypothetical protein
MTLNNSASIMTKKHKEESKKKSKGRPKGTKDKTQRKTKESNPDNKLNKSSAKKAREFIKPKPLFKPEEYNKLPDVWQMRFSDYPYAAEKIMLILNGKIRITDDDIIEILIKNKCLKRQNEYLFDELNNAMKSFNEIAKLKEG